MIGMVNYQPVLYVSGSWHERDRARAFAERARALGLRIAHEWWDRKHDDKQPAQQVLDDLRGVWTADMFVLLECATHSMRSAWAEFGAFIARGSLPPVVVVAASLDKSCFFVNHPSVVRVATDDAALEALRVRA